MSEGKRLDVAEAKEILTDYGKPGCGLDVSDVYYAATQIEAAYDSLLTALKGAREALLEAQKHVTKPSLDEFTWDYLSGKVFREALAEIERVLGDKK